MAAMPTYRNLARVRRFGTLRRFGQADGGNIVILFALGLPVMLGVAGAAVDYGNAARIRAVEQSISDATTLLVAAGDNTNERAKALTLAEAQLRSQLGNQVEVLPIQPPVWTGANVKLTINTKMKTALVHLLPGMPKEILISVSTTVNRIEPNKVTEKPKVVQLTPSAADFNVIYSYCYSKDPKRQAETDKGRRGFVAIADNAAPGTPQTNYSNNTPTECKADELQSYMLKNVKEGNSNPSKRTDKNQPNYEYFADTKDQDKNSAVLTIDVTGNQIAKNGNRTAIDTKTNKMLETIICGTLNECKSKKDGGILPNLDSRGRTPGVATQGCLEGKYLYYGWEDRSESSDKDYDDIRIVVSCPREIKVADKQLRIVE